MMKSKTIILAVLGCALCGASSAWAGPGKDTIKLTLPGKPWAVLIDLPGFKVETNEIQEGGRRYMMATIKGGYTASAFLEPTGRPASFAGCKDYHDKKAKQPGAFQITNVRQWSEGETSFLEYNIPEMSGFKLRQENLFVCKTRDNVYIDVHISKTLYKPGEEEMFKVILQTLRIEEATEASAPSTGSSQRTATNDPQKADSASMKYWKEGVSLYLKGEYVKSIAPFEKALELEKAGPQLERPYWFILVDDLGMAHGVTGNLKRAKEVFEYGVSQDANYPLFYYNLGCVCAEMGDLDKAGDFLKEAFKRKQNVLPGEQMPDPRTDDSFKPHLNDAKFRKLLDSLMADSK